MCNEIINHDEFILCLTMKLAINAECYSKLNCFCGVLIAKRTKWLKTPTSTANRYNFSALIDPIDKANNVRRIVFGPWRRRAWKRRLALVRARPESNRPSIKVLFVSPRIVGDAYIVVAAQFVRKRKLRRLLFATNERN